MLMRYDRLNRLQITEEEAQRDQQTKATYR